MANKVLRLLVIFLGISLLISCLHVAHVTSTSRLDLQAYQVSENEIMANADEVNMKVELVNERMAIEINDYPGSGANSRHNPKPPQRCSDC